MKHFSSSTAFDIVLSPRGDGFEDDAQQSDASDTEGEAHHAARKGTSGGGGGHRSPSSKRKGKGKEWHLRCDTFSEFEYWVPVFSALTSSANSADTFAKPGERLFR